MINRSSIVNKKLRLNPKVAIKYLSIVETSRASLCENNHERV